MRLFAWCYHLNLCLHAHKNTPGRLEDLGCSVCMSVFVLVLAHVQMTLSLRVL